MFPHEELLRKALKECRISQLVMDSGCNLYVHGRILPKCTAHDFEVAVKVSQILSEAAGAIADLGAKPDIM